MEAGGKVLEIGEGVAVGSSGQVEAAIVATGPPRTVGFGYKMEKGGPGTVGAVNNTHLLQFVKLISGLSEPDGVEAAGFGKNWWPGRLDVMDYTMMGRMAA